MLGVLAVKGPVESGNGASGKRAGGVDGIDRKSLPTASMDFAQGVSALGQMTGLTQLAVLTALKVCGKTCHQQTAFGCNM